MKADRAGGDVFEQYRWVFQQKGNVSFGIDSRFAGHFAFREEFLNDCLCVLKVLASHVQCSLV